MYVDMRRLQIRRDFQYYSWPKLQLINYCDKIKSSMSNGINVFIKTISPLIKTHKFCQALMPIWNRQNTLHFTVL